MDFYVLIAPMIVGLENKVHVNCTAIPSMKSIDHVAYIKKHIENFIEIYHRQ